MLKFNLEIFRKKSKCFRRSWSANHYLTYDGENFIEHIGNSSHVWYWQSSDDFETAVEDLTALDWSYVQ